MAQAFGALPTPVALPEVYSALQSRVADALEGTPTSIVSSKYYEVATNLTRTDHIFFVAYIGMTSALLATLTAEDQNICLEAGKEATEFNLRIAKAAVDEDMKKLADAKVNIIAVDKKPFRDAVAAMNDRYAQSLGPQGAEIYQAIRAVTGR
jgi:TRAP-type C4-dicarboxylate transport system substrate-binding protein